METATVAEVESKTIPIFVMGKKYEVPDTLTIMKALEYDVEKRFETSEEFRQALEALLRPAVVATAPATTPVSVGGSPAARSSEVKPLWEFVCEDEIRSSPTVSDGMIYVGYYDHNLYEIEARTGEDVWKGRSVGSGGLLTTVEDLVLWDRNFYTAEVGGPEVLEGMHERGILRSGDTINYALTTVENHARLYPDPPDRAPAPDQALSRCSPLPSNS